MPWCGRLISLVQAKIVGLVGPCGVSWPRCVCAAHLLISATRYARTSNQGELAPPRPKGKRKPKTDYVEIYVCHMPHATRRWVKFKAFAFEMGEGEVRSLLEREGDEIR